MELLPTTTTTLELPVTAYNVIFGYLEVTDLCSCRLVCTKWYTELTAKRYRKDTGYVVKGNRGNWMWDRKKVPLKTNVENLMHMKVYEYGSKENLKLKDVHISKLSSIMLKIPEFQADVWNITRLTLENVILENYEDMTVLTHFLNQFKNLHHLTMYHCHDSTSRRYLPIVIKTLIYYREKLEYGENFPRTFNSLHLIIGEDSNILHVLHMFLWYMDTLTELRLTIRHRTRSLFEQWTITRLYPNKLKVLHRSSINRFRIQYFLDEMIKKHSKTLKCLHLNWMDEDSIKDKPKVLGAYRFHLILWRYKMCKIFPQFLDCPNLALTDFAFNSKMPDDLLSMAIQSDVVPFLQRLRKIFLGRIQWDCLSWMCHVVGRFLKLLHDEDGVEVIRQLCLASSEKVVVTASKTQADDVKSRLTNFGHFFIVDVEFAIKSHFNWQDQYDDDGLPPVTQFLEWLPTSSPEENEPRIQFCQLTSLNISCEIKTIKSFSIPTICVLCPLLTVLKIVDGHEIGVKKPKNFYQNCGNMSLAKISDCDLRFIFSKLLKLQSLTLWGNLSLLSDFGMIGDTLLENGETSDTLHYLNFKEELTTVLKEELMLDENSLEYAEMESCVQNSSNHLKDLNFLSLRGVGKYVTNAITAPTSRLYQMPKLKTLEINGGHLITKQGEKCLKQAIDLVQLN